MPRNTIRAGWKGFVTLEFSNTTPLPMKLYAGEGCCQVLWFKGDRNCLVSYALIETVNIKIRKLKLLFLEFN